MRTQYFWGGAAVVFAATIGGLLAFHYLQHNPDSQASRLIRAAAAHVWTSSHGVVSELPKKKTSAGSTLTVHAHEVKARVADVASLSAQTTNPMPVEPSPSPVASAVAVIELKKADAVAVKRILEAMFLNTRVTAPTFSMSMPPVSRDDLQTGKFSLPEADDCPLFNLDIKVDDPSNSVIVAGSPMDLDMVRSVVERLDNINIPRRRTEIIQIQNRNAAGVATAIQKFVSEVVAYYKLHGQGGPLYIDPLQDIILIGEPLTNKLIVNASPEYIDELLDLVGSIDVPLVQSQHR
jgi:Bacterial type II/III secretion system short domain